MPVTPRTYYPWNAKLSVFGKAEKIAREPDVSAWQRLSAGPGTKGPRLYVEANLQLADLDAGKFDPGSDGLWTRQNTAVPAPDPHAPALVRWSA